MKDGTGGGGVLGGSQGRQLPVKEASLAEV